MKTRNETYIVDVEKDVDTGVTISQKWRKKDAPFYGDDHTATEYYCPDGPAKRYYDKKGRLFSAIYNDEKGKLTKAFEIYAETNNIESITRKREDGKYEEVLVQDAIQFDIDNPDIGDVSTKTIYISP